MKHPATAHARACHGVLAWLLVLASAGGQTRGEELPHGRAWQAVLRNHLAGLPEVAFEVRKQALVNVDETLDDDDVYRDWLVLGAHGRRGAGPRGPLDDGFLEIPASEFLLSTIEGGEGVRMSLPRHGPIPPAWRAGWDHPGNPHRGSRALKLRAHVSAAVDVMMLAEEEPRPGSDHHALHLLADTYAYVHAFDILPEDVRTAFATAIEESFARLETDAIATEGPSLGMATATACAYVARAVDDAGIAARAEALARRVVAERVRPAGYIDSGGGFDPVRNDRAATYLAWGALAAPDGWDFLGDAVRRLADLRSHLLLPEPDRKSLLAPDHFAPAPGLENVTETVGRRERQVAEAMLAPQAIAALFALREAGALPPATSAMKAEIKAAFRPDAGGRGSAAPGAVATARWRIDDAPLDLPPFDHDYYRAGTIDRLRRAASLPISRLPVFQDGATLRDFDEEFLVAKVGGAATVIHTGRIVPGRIDGGFSGGALSAYWTPVTGAVILGSRPDRTADAIEADSWETWWRWQCHALAGTAAGGRPFSTARLPRSAFTEITSMIGVDRATVTVAAPLHEPGTTGSDAVVAGALEGSLAFTRRFDVDEGAVRVESRLVGDGADRLGRLCEIIPVPDQGTEGGEGRARSATSVFLDAGSGWQPAPPRPVAAVRRLRIDRHGGAVEIAFERPMRVGLAPEAGSTCRNVLVELLDADAADEAFTTAGVAYTIRPLLSRR